MNFIHCELINMQIQFLISSDKNLAVEIGTWNVVKINILQMWSAAASKIGDNRGSLHKSYFNYTY